MKINVTSSRGLCVKKRRQLYEWRIHAWVNEVGQYGSDKCLPPNQCQAVARPILAYCHWEYKVQTSIKLKNADCKMSAFCLRLNVLVGKLVTWQITFPSSSSSQEQGDLLSCFCFLFYCPDFQTQCPVLLKIRENDKYSRRCILNTENLRQTVLFQLYVFMCVKYRHIILLVIVNTCINIYGTWTFFVHFLSDDVIQNGGCDLAKYFKS